MVIKLETLLAIYFFGVFLNLLTMAFCLIKTRILLENLVRFPRTSFVLKVKFAIIVPLLNSPKWLLLSYYGCVTYSIWSHKIMDDMKSGVFFQERNYK